MSSPNPIVTEDELQLFHESERIGALRKQPEFNRILMVMQQAVDAAQEAMERNRQPYLVHELTLRWQERKTMLDFINLYIDNVVAKRRQNIRELFESLGIDPELIDRNLDSSIDFLRTALRGKNGHQH